MRRTILVNRGPCVISTGTTAIDGMYPSIQRSGQVEEEKNSIALLDGA